MPKRGDLVLLPFPFSDLSAHKRRPVLVVTDADRYGDFIALPVTSRVQVENAVALTGKDLLTGSLAAPSWIRTNRVVTLSEGLVVKHLGQVSPTLVSEAAELVCAYISGGGRD